MTFNKIWNTHKKHLLNFIKTKIGDELDKLKIILPKGHSITAKDIEDNIGISKDYNNFELRKSIGETTKGL